MERAGLVRKEKQEKQEKEAKGRQRGAGLEWRVEREGDEANPKARGMLVVKKLRCLWQDSGYKIG
jgi:hypothetical protein